MGQKSSPIALRSQTLRPSTSLWFEESFNYGKLLSQDFSLYSYVEESLGNLGIEAYHFLISRMPKRTLFYSIAYNSKGKHIYKKKRKKTNTNTSFKKTKKWEKTLFLLSPKQSRIEKTTYMSSDKINYFTAHFSKPVCDEQSWLIHYVFNNLHKKLIKFGNIKRNKKNYIFSLKSSIKNYLNFPFTFLFSRKKNIGWKPYILSAKHIAQRIAICLKKKQRPANLIKKFFRILRKKGGQNIAGLKCSLSGRFTNRAKMAKNVSFTTGSLALNTLSNPIDFAKTNVLIPKGVVGIKIWVSFRSTKIKSSKKIQRFNRLL